ncbi:MAG: hypothetical protein Kow0026_21960 [Oricola sp.]
MVNWQKAIERNREALRLVVAALFALVGLDAETACGGQTAAPVLPSATLPRRLCNHVRRVLRAAEAAVRRLVVIAATGIEATVRPARALKARDTRGGDAARIPSSRGKGRVAGDAAIPPFPLIDPLKRFGSGPGRPLPNSVPLVTFLGGAGPWPEPGPDRSAHGDDGLPAAALCRRLLALKAALDDLDGQARRLARWKARRDAGRLRARRLSPMRPGWPPGYRKRGRHDVDEVLKECHRLAVWAVNGDP